MQRRTFLLTTGASLLTPALSRADGQYRVLVLAMPSEYHYEYIPVARDSFERLSKLHAFELSWTHTA